MPETPRYLVHTGEEESAREVLEELPGEDSPQERIEEIQEVEEEQTDSGVAALLLAPMGPPRIDRRVRAGGVPAAGRDQHDHLLRADDADERRVREDERDLRESDHRRDQRRDDDHRDQALDRVGRKPLLLAGVAGMVTSLLVLGISIAALATPHHPGDPAAIITLICLTTFIAASRRRGDRWCG